ncbi:MAG: hypothetical protein WCA44_01815 [Acidobacteriaceae bacterium]
MHAWPGVAILAAAAVCLAQPVHQPPERAQHRVTHHRAAKKPAHAAIHAGATTAPQAQPQPPAPLKPVDQPAQPATITLSGGKLAVKANNSSLNEIVNELGKSGGITISGLDQDQRVFGDYGPGDPRQVLSELLEGAGYNVLMLGVTQQGTPRQLVLSERGNAPASSPQSFPQQNDQPQPADQQPLYQRQPGPPQPGNLNFPTRSPAQMYQQMMQQRQQQNQPQPQPQ